MLFLFAISTGFETRYLPLARIILLPLDALLISVLISSPGFNLMVSPIAASFLTSDFFVAVLLKFREVHPVTKAVIIIVK